MTVPLNFSSTSLINKRIGQRLLDCHLISEAKLQAALYEQTFFKIRLGEILVAHGWTEQQTVDFFVDQWPAINHQAIRYPLGQYLLAAGLIDTFRIETILHNQERNGRRFGANAVLLGLIKQETIDYFINHLFPEQKDIDPDKFTDRETTVQPQLPVKETTIQPQLSAKETIVQPQVSGKETTVQPLLSRTGMLDKLKPTGKNTSVQQQLSEKETIVQSQLTGKETTVQPQITEKETMTQSPWDMD